MSYVAPAIKEKFESLSPNLQQAVLEKNQNLHSIHDLIRALDQIVKEDEQRG